MRTAGSEPAVAPDTRLVLVHGSRLSHTQWAPQVPFLEGFVDLVLPDLPGHGGRADEPFTMDRAVGAIAAAVESPSPSGVPPVRTVLVGHSLGGYTAMAYAATFPRRLDGLVLLGSAAVPTGPGATAYRAVSELTDRAGTERMTRVNDRVLRALYPADLIDPVIAGGYFFTPTAAAWREVMARCRPTMLRAVTCPVLVTGGRFDQLVVHARRYARAAPRGRVALVPWAGHLVGFDQPERLAAVILGLVRSVEAEAVAAREVAAGDGKMASP